MIKPPSCVSFVVLVFSLLAPAASAALSAPTGLAASNLKATSFTLTWAAATGGTGGIAGYDIIRDGGLIGSTTTRSYAVTNLLPLTSYGMTVTARDGAGVVSISSAMLAVTTLADTVAPSRPVDLVATNVTTSSCTLTWTGSTDNVGVTGYNVYRSGVLLSSSTTTTVDISGLAPDTNNNLTVRAADAAGNLSTASVALAVRTLALSPSIPTGLATTNLKATSFTLTWAASTGGAGGIASYDVLQNGTLVGAAVVGRTFAVAGLTPTTVYPMTVISRDSAGNVSPASVALEVTTPPDTTAPTRPADLAASSITTTSFSLSWTGSTDNVGVSGYNICRSGVLLGTTTATTYQVSGLIPDSTNNITVRSVDAAGNLSAASVALSVRMVALPPSGPTGLMTTNLKPASFRLTWTASTGGTGGIAGYDVYLNGSLVGSPAGRALAITGLVPTTTYTMTVVSRDAVGNRSVPSDSLLVTTPADTTKPTVPKGLSAAEVTASSFTLTWTASTDNVGVAGYDVFRNNVFIGSTQIASFNVTGLPTSTLSSMRLKARDAAGNISGFSAALTVTTSAPPNVPPAIALSVPADGATFTLPFAVTLSATANDSDGTITKVEFFDNGLLLGETATPASPNTFTFPLTFTSAGVHSLSARATDNRNATTDSAPVAITVNNSNQSPTVALTASAAGIAPAFITLTAEATDSDGTIAKIEFYEGSNLLGEVLAPTTEPSTYTFPLTLFSTGTYTITAVATDNSTAQSASAPVVITVNSGAAALPFVANFESSEGFHVGPLSGQLSWFATEGIAVVPAVTPGGQQELSIPAAEPAEIFSHDFSAPGVSPVFVDFQANPVAGSDPTTAVMFSTPAAQVALVGTASPASIWIFGGGGQGWYATNQTVPVDATGRSIDRIRLTTREDYLTKKWDLFLNSQMIAADVAFADDNATALTDFSVNGHATTASAFDSFYAGPENPLFADANHNGLDDVWESAHSLSLATDNRQSSPAGNGVTVLQSYLNGTDPNDFYNGSTPVITVLVGGNGQPGIDGLIQIRLTKPDGPTIGNAPLTFAIAAGGSRLAASAEATATLVYTLSLHSLADGTASAYYRTPAGQPIDGTVTIQAGATTAQLVFQARTESENQPPVVALTAPLDGAALNGFFGVVLAASAYDPEDLISKVEFFVDGIEVGKSATAPYYFYWDSAIFGSHTVVAKATDNLGLTATSAAISVTYNPVTPAFIAHDFELSERFVIGLLSGQNGWRASPEGVLVTDETARSGTQSMAIMPTPETFNGIYMAELDLGRPVAVDAVRFIDFWIKAVSDGTVGTSSYIMLPGGPRIGFVRNSTEAELQCYWQDEGAENQWFSGISVPVEANGITSDWHRITVREDSASRKLDVYLDGQLAFADLYYYSGDDRFGLNGHSSSTARLDQFRVLADNPLFVDSDRDGMDDSWEAANGLNPSVNDHYFDNDHDGVSNFHEYSQGTPVANPIDTDNNGLTDRWEMQNFGNLGVNPDGDVDGDSVSNWIEEYFGINPKQGDSDGDGLDDGQEIALGTDPSDPNSKAPQLVSWFSRTTSTTTTTSSPETAQYGIQGINVNSPNYYSRFEWTMVRTGSDADRTYSYREDFVPATLQWRITKDFEGWPDHDGHHLNPYAPEGESYSAKGLHWTGGPGAQGTNSFRDRMVSFAVSHGWSPGSDTSMDWTQSGYYVGVNGDLRLYTDEFKIRLSNRMDPTIIRPGSTNTNTYQTGWSTNPPTASLDANSTTTSEYNILVPEGMSGTIRWFEIFTPANDPDNQVFTARSWTIDGTKRPTATLSTNSSGSTTVLFYDAQLAVDANRDGEIKLAGEDDSDATSAEKPFRFWINDDDDSGDVANDDTPIITSGNHGPADYQGSGTYFGVDGTCDLIDFFPVHLDIRQLLTVLPPTSTGIQYKLKQADSALNFVYTNLTLAEAFHYLKHNRDRQAYGTPGSETYAGQAPTVWITATGALLNADFLARIKNEADKGVILVEGRMAIDKTLRLVVEKAGVEIAEVALYLKISPVEDMYRWINLRGVSGQTETRATNVKQPPAYPDALTNGKMFVWVHGYNVNEQQSRGWNAEAFKRLWHSGSKAMFTAVTWHGDHSQITLPIVEIYVAPDYWDNIPNAFLTAEALAPLVNALPGSAKVIAGHSMGNVVVSSAIKDHGMNVAKYLMVDAAVALEAYDTSISTVGPYYVNAMSPLRWADFERRLWSTDWWRLFPEKDNRRRLTWMNRFGNIPEAINVYSSGEDVLNNNDLTPGEPPYGPHIWQVGTERSWIQQEMVKGTLDKVSLLAWEIQGGWGLNSFWENKEWVPDDSDAGGYFRRWPKTPAEAAVITDAELRAWPYFERFNKSSLMNADVGPDSSGSNAADAATIADLLGGAIPALSFPAGRNAVPIFGNLRNYDLMNIKDGWPVARSTQRWRHSDIRNVAYFFNYGAWDLFTTEGNLR